MQSSPVPPSNTDPSAVSILMQSSSEKTASSVMFPNIILMSSRVMGTDDSDAVDTACAEDVGGSVT